MLLTAWKGHPTPMNPASLNPRLATVPLVEERDAKGMVREIFDDIKATKGIDFVPNFWRTLATYPPLLEETWRRLKSIMTPGRLDVKTKEMIALAVSATNGCDYCINSHTAALKKLGVDDATLGELMAVVGLYNTTNTLADAYQVRPDVFPPT
jgi:AhpD family alkylhydroperoxidase